jgi:hypothetical protein
MTGRVNRICERKLRQGAEFQRSVMPEDVYIYFSFPAEAPYRYKQYCLYY